MKKRTKLLITVLLAFVLVTTLASAAAFADFSGSCTAGQPIAKSVVFSTTSTIQSFSPATGALPSGIVIDSDSTTLFITGTPQSAGTYESGYWVQTDAGTESFKLTLSVAAAPTPTPTPTPKTTVAPTAAPAATDLPKITKHPTGETVETGGSAKFISRADNATEIVWRIVSADTTNTIPASDAASYFTGVTVSGLGTDTLVLSNIPKSMNGWSVECKFLNANGSSFSNGAVIKVVDKTTNGTTDNNNNTNNNTATTGTTAAITTQPRGVESDVGKNCTLSVSATSPNNGKLTYQWYSSTTNSRANIISIKDATANTYTPPQTEGTVYYCVAVINTKDNKQSTPVYSDLVAVRYNAAAAASPAPTATPTATPGATATNSPTPTSGPDSSTDNRYTLTSSLAFFAVMGVLAIAAMVVIIIYIKRSGNEDDDDE